MASSEDCLYSEGKNKIFPRVINCEASSSKVYIAIEFQLILYFNQINSQGVQSMWFALTV